MQLIYAWLFGGLLYFSFKVWGFYKDKKQSKKPTGRLFFCDTNPKSNRQRINDWASNYYPLTFHEKDYGFDNSKTLKQLSEKADYYKQSNKDEFINECFKNSNVINLRAKSK